MAILSADLGFREHFSRIVERGLEGFAVRCLADAGEVLPLPGQEPPSLLIVDAGAGAEDGAPALLLRLRRDERLRRVPALLLSGEPLRPDDVAALDGCARVVLLNRDILTDAEALRLVRRLLFLPKGSSPFGGSLARRAVAWLNLNYRHPVARWQLAEAVSVSEDHLTRVFQRELGISPWAYLNRWRIHRARLLLSREEVSVQEVSAGAASTTRPTSAGSFAASPGSPPSSTAGRRPDEAGICRKNPKTRLNNAAVWA